MSPSLPQPPGLPNVERRITTLNGQQYHYLFSQKGDSYKDTVVLIHGFPDISFGWRKQIPFFSEQGYRVIAIDTIGYGASGCPRDQDPNKELPWYGAKANTTAMAELLDQLAQQDGKPVAPAIFIGHDWGSYTAQRMALWHPHLVKGLAILSVPWASVRHQPVKLEQLAAMFPDFGYQVQFASYEFEHLVESMGDRGLRNMIQMTGGMTEAGPGIFNTKTGIDVDKFSSGELHSAMYEDEELFAYVLGEFKRNGIHGPLNAYRVVTPLNPTEEMALPKSEDVKMEIPTLFIRGLKDNAVSPLLCQGQERFFQPGKLTSKEIDAGHFMQLEKPNELNHMLLDWITTTLSLESERKSRM